MMCVVIRKQPLSNGEPVTGHVLMASAAPSDHRVKKPFAGQNIFELYHRDAEAAEQQRKPQPTQPPGGSAPWNDSPKKEKSN
jgi:hypothetical protein